MFLNSNGDASQHIIRWLQIYLLQMPQAHRLHLPSVSSSSYPLLTSGKLWFCREDVATAEGLSPEDAAELWHNLASAASSGWDFSSRWFKDGHNLTTCQTTIHLPTDLNSFLYKVQLPPFMVRPAPVKDSILNETRTTQHLLNCFLYTNLERWKACLP